MHLIKHLLSLLACQPKILKIYQHQMIVCTTGYNRNTSLHKACSKCLSIHKNLFLIILEVITECFLQCNSLCCDYMHQRAALSTRENSRIQFLCIFFCTAENHTASWSAKCLMGCCCNNMCIRDRAWMQTCCHKTGNMGNINHQNSINLVCDFSKSLEINCSAVCAGTSNNQLRLTFKSNSFYFIIVNKTVFINTIRYTMEILA